MFTCCSEFVLLPCSWFQHLNRWFLSFYCMHMRLSRGTNSLLYYLEEYLRLAMDSWNLIQSTYCEFWKNVVNVTNNMFSVTIYVHNTYWSLTYVTKQKSRECSQQLDCLMMQSPCSASENAATRMLFELSPTLTALAANQLLLLL